MSPITSAVEERAENVYMQDLMMFQALAWICLVWYVVVAIVCTVGYVQMYVCPSPSTLCTMLTSRSYRFRHYSKPPVSWNSPNDNAAGPIIDIIRPVKGMEPYLYDCLASTFRQDWVAFKLRFHLCIASRSDPAFPVLEKLVKDFGDFFHVKIYVEEEDEWLNSEHGRKEIGPNPKIRNMSRAYREIEKTAAPHVIWIIDCNVWVAEDTLYHMMVAAFKAKFAHQLPLVIDTSDNTFAQASRSLDQSWRSIGGARLEEMFMSTSHAKFYTAINTVSIAPCIVGKSTMFQKEHLDALTDGKGIDYFSHNICEDHLIGDLLWKRKVPDEDSHKKYYGRRMGKHQMAFGALAIQPMASVSVGDYWARRVRWLRVRKFTVFIATLVEPGTESFLCSAYGAFAATSLPVFHEYLGVPQTWTTFGLLWFVSVSMWCVMDWTLYRRLHSGSSIPTHHGTHVPDFVKSPEGAKKRPLGQWLLAWLGREALALPIWLWAFYGGTTVEWRGKKFWVGLDMKVHEIMDEKFKMLAIGSNGHADPTKRKAR